MSRSVRLVWIAAILAACRQRSATPARIVVAADSLILNSTEWTLPNVRVLDDHGHQIDGVPLQVTAPSSPRMAIRQDGAISCQSDGAGVVNVRAGTAHATLPIRCHLIRRFGPPLAARVVAGGPPTPLATPQAFDQNGDAIPEYHVQAQVIDTAIIALRGGLVYGLRPGNGAVELRSAGVVGAAFFLVEAPSRDSTTKAAVGQAGTSRPVPAPNPRK